MFQAINVELISVSLSDILSESKPETELKGPVYRAFLYQKTGMLWKY